MASLEISIPKTLKLSSLNLFVRIPTPHPTSSRLPDGIILYCFKIIFNDRKYSVA